MEACLLPAVLSLPFLVKERRLTQDLAATLCFGGSESRRSLLGMRMCRVSFRAYISTCVTRRPGPERTTSRMPVSFEPSGLEL